MAIGSLRFDPFLPQIQSNELKSMARLWGGSSLTRKHECISLIQQSLADPAKVRAAVATLTPAEANALALIKAAGGAMEARAFVVALRASGAPLPGRSSARRDDHAEVISHLIKRGLVLNSNPQNPTYATGYGRVEIFSDERLLAAAGALAVAPFVLKPIAPPSATVFRRPPAIALNLIGLLQAIENHDGIGLTQNGLPRVNEVRRIAKAMGWSADMTLVDGLPFPDLVPALIHALRYGGLLNARAGYLTLAMPVSEFAAQPYAEQVRPLFNGFREAGEWNEGGFEAGYDATSPLLQARQALAAALSALPNQGVNFFAVDDLDRALFERIGEHFSFDHLPPAPHTRGKTPAEAQQQLRAWQTRARKAWLGRERPWIDRALTTWCYFLGLVELGLRDKAPHALRLTDLGRAVLHPGQTPYAILTKAEDGAAWVVQPNFEILVYLDRTTSQQLAFLERHAERLQAQQHVAQYRLTRQAIYAALESGSELNRLLADLQSGAGQPLPQNVVAEIRAWAALRDQVTIYRRAHLVEYADAAARDAATTNLPGVVVGDRFLLVNAAQAAQTRARVRVNYAAALTRCLVADEEGVLTVTTPPPDLLLDAQLGCWAEPRGAGRWQLTRASVAAGVKAGLALTELLKLLTDRLLYPLPRLLHVALSAWAGEPSAVSLTEIVVLQCRQPAIFEAIVSSPKLYSLLRGELAPNLVAVDRAQLDALRQQLDWLGLEISPELTVTRRRCDGS